MGGQSSSERSRDGDGQKEDDPSAPPRLYVNCSKASWPLVYSPEYNLKLMGLEKLSKYDLLKLERVCGMLVEKKILAGMNCFVAPLEPSEKELRKVHTEEYLTSLKRKGVVSSITGLPGLGIIPYSIFNNKILRPFRLQAGGTIIAGKLAMENGWAVNIGGGQHHCSAGRSTPLGFSPYADITLNIKFLWDNFPLVQKVLIVDLDVHQGNGYARDFTGNDNVFIFDIYNSTIFPHDEDAKKAIKRKVEIQSGVEDEEYLKHVRENIDAVLDEFKPQYVVYNAGVDILLGDPLGELKVTPEGVIERDRMVFAAVRSRDIPIVMLLSGGFAKTAASTVAASIANLHRVGLIEGSKSNITSQD